MIGVIVGGVVQWQIGRRRNDLRPGTRLVPVWAESRQVQTDLPTVLPAIPTAAAQVDPDPGRHDQLEQIKGIGPVFAGHLNAAGVVTFADLAELTPERVAEIVSTKESGHLIEPVEWIAQARQLAGTEATL